MRTMKTEIAGDNAANIVRITRTNKGASVEFEGVVFGVLDRNADDAQEAAYEIAKKACQVMYGLDRKGRVAATNSMVYDVARVIEQVAL